MNLATARSGSRAKEIGLRKVIGAHRLYLIIQFFFESLLLTFTALFLAVLLVSALMPVFSSLSGKILSFNLFNQPHIWPILLGVALLTGILSGSYPAFFLSSFQPAKIFKGKIIAGSRGAMFRKILVFSQFVLTIFLITGTLIIQKQLSYMQNKKLGFDKDCVIRLQMRENLREKYEVYKSELLQSPNIVNVTSSFVPANIGSGTYALWEGKDPDMNVFMYRGYVDYNYLEFFKMEMSEGRFFSKEFPTDGTEGFVINETAVKAMKIDSPVGKAFSIPEIERRGRIIGVVKDFHFRSLHNEIEPFILLVDPDSFHELIVKVDPGNISSALGFLEEKWKKFVPDFPFEFSFLDETLDKKYGTEKRISALFRYFTLLAIFIACLGLSGLASFLAEQRTKEIGIRKVLGATESNIVVLLAGEFGKLVLAANLIAWPVAYIAMRRWLQDFAFRTSMALWIFAVSAALALIIAMLTVLFQSLKAARSLPAVSLKYE
jgi:ABC-type antimicrobial peptide transport system permease subunit